MRLLKSLIGIDMISPGIRLRLNNKTSFKNIGGAILTFISCAFVAYVFFKDALSLINKTSPTININNQFVYPQMVLNKTNVPIAFVLGGGKGPLSSLENNSLFLNFTPCIAEGHAVNTSNNVQVNTYKPLKWGPCNTTYFGKYKDLFLKQMAGKLEGYYCIDTSNITLFNTSSIAPYKTLELFFAICDETRTKCLDYKSLMKTWSQLVAQFYFIDHYIDVLNVDNPIQNYVNVKYFWFSSNTYSRYYFTFTPLSVISNNGWILDEYETLDAHQFNPNVVNDFFISNFTDPLVKFRVTISLNNLKSIYNRSYSKIQDIFANAGGLFRACTSIAFLANYIFFLNLMYSDLANHYYNTDKIFKNNSGENFDSIFKRKNFKTEVINKQIFKTNKNNLTQNKKEKENELKALTVFDNTTKSIKLPGNSSTKLIDISKNYNNTQVQNNSLLNLGKENTNPQELNYNHTFRKISPEKSLNLNNSSNIHPINNKTVNFSILNNESNLKDNNISINIDSSINKLNLPEKPVNNIQKILTEEKKLLKIKELKYIDRLLLSCHCSSRKKRYYDAIKDKIDEKMSIEYLFQKYREIDFMKYKLEITQDIEKPKLIVAETAEHNFAVKDASYEISFYGKKKS